jgi:hypothetical protein
MNAMAPIEGLEGSGKPLFHISGSSVIADNARCIEPYSLRMTARSRRTDKAHSRGYRSTRA